MLPVCNVDCVSFLFCYFMSDDFALGCLLSRPHCHDIRLESIIGIVSVFVQNVRSRICVWFLFIGSELLLAFVLLLI